MDMKLVYLAPVSRVVTFNLEANFCVSETSMDITFGGGNGGGGGSDDGYFDDEIQW